MQTINKYYSGTNLNSLSVQDNRRMCIRMGKMLRYLTIKQTYSYILRHPNRIISNLKLLLHEDDYSTFIANLLDVSVNQVNQMKPDKESQKILNYAFKKSIAPSTDQSPCDEKEALSLYLITRILKPEIVIETGVSAGRSSSYILCALRDNQKGELHSIDPYTKAGHAIPEILKNRWHFYAQTSHEVLPKLLKQFGKIDLFIHDSLHTYENMKWEFETAYPHIRENGLLLGDDIDWNIAFQEFATKIAIKPVLLNEAFGGIKKEKKTAHMA